MLCAAVCREAAEACSVRVDDADLITGLHFKYLTGEDDLSFWLNRG